MKLLINRSDYGYSVPLKNEFNGETIKYYLQVTFGKNITPPVKNCQIEAKSYFFSCYKKKDDTTAPKLIITDFEVLQEYEQNKPKGAELNPVDNDDLPF